MKNSVATVLLSVTLAFAAFVGGFYIGRNTGRPDIEVSGFTATAPISQETPSAPTSGTDPSTPAPSATGGTAPEDTVPETTAPEVKYPININTATPEQLQLLPGIGPVLAQRISDYRTELGAFTSVEELLDVKGIGEKTLEKLLPYITV